MVFRVASGVSSGGGAAALTNNGMFLSTQNQANGGATTANLVTLNTTVDTATNISNAAGVITFQAAGKYQVMVETFWTSTTGANPIIASWLNQNGTNISNSTQDFQLQGGANAIQIMSCVWFVTALTNDTLRVYWHSSNTNVSLVAQAAGANPTRPASPSAIVAIHQIA